MPVKTRVALITGITGQDGSHLAEILLEKGYIVHGIVRRSSSFNRSRIEHLYEDPDNEQRFHLHYGDITDPFSLLWILKKVRPDEIYHLAAQSHVQVSFETPYLTSQVTGVGTLNLLESVRVLELNPKIYVASTSELFSGDPKQAPQNEKTRLEPKSPYGVAKLYSHEIARIYRESYGMFICRGILFNHEGPRRGENFVTRKITLGVTDIIKKRKTKIYLGNLDAQRDWGLAANYMEAAWLMLQRNKPDDFVIATGETHSIREFAEAAFGFVGLKMDDYVEVRDVYKRPNEVNYLRGDATKAKIKLGWEPRVTFQELVRIMMKSDLKESLREIEKNNLKK